jgi:hypothetical protein
MDLTGSGHGSVAGSCEHGNEPAGYIKAGDFPDYLSDHKLLKRDTVPWN